MTDMLSSMQQLTRASDLFGSLPLDLNNRWIKLSKQIPWQEFDLKYRENFKSKKGQPACDSRMALGAVLLKPAYKGLSDDDITQVIAENPYLQHSSSQFNVYMKRLNLGS